MDWVLGEATVEHDGALVTWRSTRTVRLIRHDLIVTDTTVVLATQVGQGAWRLTARPGAYFFALGRQNLSLGHAAFDDRYILKSNDPVAARFWLDDVALDAMLATYDPNAVHPFELELSGQRIVLRAHHDHGVGSFDQVDRTAPSRVTRVDEAIAATAAIANRGRRLGAAWAERLHRLGAVDDGGRWRTDDSYGVNVARGSARVHVDFPWRVSSLRRAGLRTRLTIEWPAGPPAALWRSSARRASRPTTTGPSLSPGSGWRGRGQGVDAIAAMPGALATLAALTTDWMIIGDRRLAIGWERIIDDEHILDRALTALAALAGGAAADAAPYR